MSSLFIVRNKNTRHKIKERDIPCYTDASQAHERKLLVELATKRHDEIMAFSSKLHAKRLRNLLGDKFIVSYGPDHHKFGGD